MSSVLIVDDDDAFRHSLVRLMQGQGFASEEAPDAPTAQAMIAAGDYSLVLLDVNMPGQSGMELLSEIRTAYPGLAVVMVTGRDEPTLAVAALETGAYGYVVKPFRPNELLISVANAMIRRDLEIESARNMDRLKSTVDTRTKELLTSVQRLQVAQAELGESYAEIILRLARLAEFRDEETGHHVNRMSRYCGVLAHRMGLLPENREQIEIASRLHDVGKVGVPDGILFKPGKLTLEEYTVVKLHPQRGYEILAGSESEVVSLGAQIALTHHEWWDGSGYPHGLAGTDIPLEGRIAAVADVFDALTSRRVYRPAFPVHRAIDMMKDLRGRQFDPDVLDHFLGAMDEVSAIRQSAPD